MVRIGPRGGLCADLVDYPLEPSQGMSPHLQRDNDQRGDLQRVELSFGRVG